MISQSVSQMDYFHIGNSMLSVTLADASAASIYDLNQIQRSDLLRPRPNDDAPEQRYTFIYERYDFNFAYQYNLSDDCLLKFELPTSYHTLTKKTDTSYTVDNGTGTAQTVTERYNFVDVSRYRIEHITIGIDYRIWNKKSFVVLSTSILMPGSIENDINKSSNSDFLSNSFLEVLSGFYFGAKSNKYYYQTGIFYNYRNRDLKSFFVIDLRATLSTIEGTWLGFNFKYLQSLSSFRSAVPIDPQRTIVQENKVQMGAFFRIDASKNIYGEFNYLVDLTGRNTLKIGVASVKLGYIF